jgi:DNA-binding NarL/FixJ family response regulator
MLAHTNKGTGQRRPARILLVDDHPLVRQGLADLLRRELDFEVCGEAASHEEALRAIAASPPDLVTVDLSLKDSHGLDLIKDIRARFPAVRVLVVTVHDEALHVEWALRAGASGYITKEEATLDVVHALRAVLRGEFVLSPQLASQVGAALSGHTVHGTHISHHALSDRELQVLELIGEGLDRHQIAERLRLDVNTVETYRARLKEKLHLKDAHELLQHAIRFNRGAPGASP